MLEAPGAASGRLPLRHRGRDGVGEHARQPGVRGTHGGIKYSGFGSDLSVFSIEPYTQVKHVMIRSV